MPEEQSFHHFHVQHFCPLAQGLERLGDRWSWLIVRDLMRAPQRFSDLQRYLAGITPKRLTANLRALESGGIVEREHVEGRREVWYRLTAQGKALGPVIKALVVWGIEYSTRVPAPDETLYPEHMMGGLCTALNQHGQRVPQPVRWTLCFGVRSVFTISFDGELWSVEPTDIVDADVRIETTPQAWASFILSRVKEERLRFLNTMDITGEQPRVNELLAINWRGKQP